MIQVYFDFYTFFCTIASTCLKVQYKGDLGGGTAIPETPEMERVKRNQQNISTVHCGVILYPKHKTRPSYPYII